MTHTGLECTTADRIQAERRHKLDKTKGSEFSSCAKV